MAVSQAVLEPPSSQRLLTLSPRIRPEHELLLQDSGECQIPNYDLTDLSDPQEPALGEKVKSLPNPKQPFAAENLEHLKALQQSEHGEDFQNADRMLAAIVAITANEADIKTEPINYLQEIDSYRYQVKRVEKGKIQSRIDQLKTNGKPGSKRAAGPYDSLDKSEVKRLAPHIALTAIDAFVNGTQLKNFEHENPQAFTLSAQDTSQVLENIFKIVKEKI